MKKIIIIFAALLLLCACVPQSAAPQIAEPIKTETVFEEKTLPDLPLANPAEPIPEKEDTPKPQEKTEMPQGKTETPAPAAEKSCTLSISCSTVCANLADLDAEKAELIPPDGCILPPTKCTLSEGESVFDVLLRVCRERKIHMEFSETPAYQTAYIEGIGNLYEFDCGALSGWMYRVNGVFPNFGCSRYALEDGDTVEWLYTCDLGADIGGTNAAGGQ